MVLSNKQKWYYRSRYLTRKTHSEIHPGINLGSTTLWIAMYFRLSRFLLVKILFPGVFLLLPYPLLAESIFQSNRDYLELTKGLPIEFQYTRASEILDGAILLESVTFRSINPTLVDDNGDKWYERFDFVEKTYISESTAKKAFEEKISEFTNDKRMAAKCPFYSVREKTRVYILSVACNFNWDIDRIVKNMKASFISEDNELSVAIRCDSYGSCRIINNGN
jgi:hypothetical protein